VVSESDVAHVGNQAVCVMLAVRWAFFFHS
jgi:hypothetical protein